MAIVKMKGLRLVAMRRDREDLLRDLQHTGAVQVEQPDASREDPVRQGLCQPDPAGLAQAQEELSALERASAVLKSRVPVKTGLLTARPVVSQKAFFDPAQYDAALRAAQEINDAERDAKAAQAQRGKLLSQKASLAPWLSLDLPLDYDPKGELRVQLGTLPAALPLAQAEGGLQAVSDLAQLTQVSEDRELRYCVFSSHRDVLEEVSEALRGLNWNRVSFREWTGTALENDKRIDRELQALEAEERKCQTRVEAQAKAREAISQAMDRAALDVQRELAKTNLLDTESAFWLEGWFPAKQEEQLKQVLGRYACAWESWEPSQEEYPSVPVQLENGKLVRTLNMVTDMYSLPAYGSVDPNPLMAPFFILFYGMMMADMGYGLLMMLASWVVVKKTKPNGATMRYMMPLLGLCGISTFIWGALTAGFFGDFIPQLLGILNHTSSDAYANYPWPALFSPLDDALAVLMGSLALGVLQIFTGMAVSMVKQIKRGETMAALCSEGAWFLVFILAGAGFATGQVQACLIAVLVVLVLTQGYGKKGIMGKIMGIFGSLYNNITGYFSDIMSYSRLMALMLAGAVVAQVFNKLGAITGNVVTFFIIAMIGNALNFALNILGCFVHDMRLQCLEFFGRFYEDGGKPFRPLNINTKYVDIQK